MKIFLLEDDKSLNSILCDFLSSKNYHVSSFLSSKEAIEHIFDDFDIYLLDLNMPDINGLEILRTIRAKNQSTPVIVISGKTDIKSVLEGYKLGCSDYLRKPFDPRELLAKISTLTNSTSQVIKLSYNCSYDFSTSSLNHKSKKVSLTKNETKILSYLIKHQGQVVSKEKLSKYVWDEDSNRSDEALRSAIFRLRQKLPRDLIKSHFDMGLSID